MTKSTPDKIFALIKQLKKYSAHITCAESCTGGLLAAALTEPAGASQWFDGALVTYKPTNKTQWLGINTTLIQLHGIISEPVALAMANGAMTRCLTLYHDPPKTYFAIGITGIAGPTSDELHTPIGQICFGFMGLSTQYPHLTFSHTTTQHFAGDRYEIRNQAVDFAINSILQLITS